MMRDANDHVPTPFLHMHRLSRCVGSHRASLSATRGITVIHWELLPANTTVASNDHCRQLDYEAAFVGNMTRSSSFAMRVLYTLRRRLTRIGSEAEV